MTRELSEVRKRLAGRSAVVRLPELLWGGNPAGIGDACNWILNPEDESSGTYRLRLKERRNQRPARLLSANKMGHRSNVDSPGTFARLGALPPYHPMSEADSQVMARRIRDMRDRDDRLATKLSAAVLRIQSCTRDDLAEVVRNILASDLLPLNPDAATWLIGVDPALSMRFALVRALLMVEEDPHLLANAQNRQQEIVFASARGLLGDTSFGMAAYITPLLLAQSPWTMGLAAPRNGGIVVLLFGQLMQGQTGVASELLQLFHPNSGGIRTLPAATSVRQHEAAIGWWTQQLDQLFTEVTDPCNYRRLDESFDVRAQFETMLGLEQAFRNLQSILAADRDAHAGRVTCLDTLDTLEGPPRRTGLSSHVAPVHRRTNPP